MKKLFIFANKHLRGLSQANYTWPFFLCVLILILVSFTVISPQHIAVDFAWTASDNTLLHNTTGSIITKTIPLFGNISSEIVSVLFSILISLTSLVGLFIYAKYSKLDLIDTCIFLGFIFLIDYLGVVKLGMNYPMRILTGGSNTYGAMGLAFSILSIGLYKYRKYAGNIALVVAILVHPTIGLLTSAYVSLKFLVGKNYINTVYPVLISIGIILLNYDNMSVDGNYSLLLGEIIGVHRREILLSDIQFLLVPLVLTLLSSNKKQFIVEWLFITICLSVSFLYYNLSMNFMRHEIMALMPSRGVNIGVAIIVLKFYIDFLLSPNKSKIIFSVILFFLFTPYAITNIGFIFFISIYACVSLMYCFRLKKSYILALILFLVSFTNFRVSHADASPRGYDDFFKSKQGYVLTLDADYAIMVRNKGITELIPMGLMDAYIYDPKGLISANKIFHKIFDINLWDLKKQNEVCGCIRFKDIQHLNIDIKSLRQIEPRLKYILAPSHASLDLPVAWVGDNGLGTNFTVYQLD
jgi:hypothetical protein